MNAGRINWYLQDMAGPLRQITSRSTTDLPHLNAVQLEIFLRVTAGLQLCLARKKFNRSTTQILRYACNLTHDAKIRKQQSGGYLGCSR